MNRSALYVPLQALLRQHKLPLLFIYGLNGVVSILSLCVAPAAGLMIESLVHHDGWGPLWFALSYIGWQGFASILRIQDTKVFSRIFNQLSLDLLDQQHRLATPIPSTKLNARIELLKQVVSFFENDFPFLLSSIISIIGSCMLLYLYNRKLVIVSVIILGPSIWINQRYAHKLRLATKAVNDQFEHQVDVINSYEPIRQQVYFSTLRLLNIHRSTLEATNFALLEVFVFVMIFTSIYFLCQTESLGYGQVIGSYGLILRFAYSFDFIPHLTTRLAALQDILHRIQTPIGTEN